MYPDYWEIAGDRAEEEADVLREVAEMLEKEARE